MHAPTQTSNNTSYQDLNTLTNGEMSLEKDAQEYDSEGDNGRPNFNAKASFYRTEHLKENQAYQKKTKRKKRKFLTKPSTNKTIFDQNLKVRHRFLAQQKGFNNTSTSPRHNPHTSIQTSYYNYFHIIPSNYNENFENYNFSKEKFSTSSSSSRESSFEPPSMHSSHNPTDPHLKTSHHKPPLFSTDSQQLQLPRYKTPLYLSRKTSHPPPLLSTQESLVVVGQCYAVQYKTLGKHWVTISDVPSSQRHFNWVNPSRGVKYHFRVVPMFVVTSVLSPSAPSFEFSQFNLKSSSGLSRLSGHSISSQRLLEGDPSETVTIDADDPLPDKSEEESSRVLVGGLSLVLLSAVIVVVLYKCMHVWKTHRIVKDYPVESDDPGQLLEQNDMNSMKRTNHIKETPI